MSTIIADSRIIDWLSSLTEITEVRDSNGYLIGVFTPQPLTEQSRAIDKARDLFDLEEAARILGRERDQGLPLAEVLKKLHALETSQ